MLKTVLIVVVVLLVVLLGVGFLAPNRLTVERSVVIAAEPAAVHVHLNDIKTWPEWSAWTKEKDPTAKWEFSGAASGVGQGPPSRSRRHARE